MCFQLEYQRQQLLADRQSFHMEQLKYAEMRARQQHFQQIQHQQHSQAGGPHANQAAPAPAPAPLTASQQAPNTPAPQPAPSPAPPSSSSASAPESQPPQGAHNSPPCPPGATPAPHSSSSSSTTPVLHGKFKFFNTYYASLCYLFSLTSIFFNPQICIAISIHLKKLTKNIIDFFFKKALHLLCTRFTPYRTDPPPSWGNATPFSSSPSSTVRESYIA